MFKSKIRDGGMPHHHELTGSGGSTISFHSRRRARGVWIQAISYLVGRLRSCVTLFNASVRPSCSSSLLWANITMQTRCDSCMHHGCQAARMLAGCTIPRSPLFAVMHARDRIGDRAVLPLIVTLHTRESSLVTFQAVLSKRRA